MFTNTFTNSNVPSTEVTVTRGSPLLCEVLAAIKTKEKLFTSFYGLQGGNGFHESTLFTGTGIPRCQQLIFQHSHMYRPSVSQQNTNESISNILLFFSIQWIRDQSISSQNKIAERATKKVINHHYIWQNLFYNLAQCFAGNEWNVLWHSNHSRMNCCAIKVYLQLKRNHWWKRRRFDCSTTTMYHCNISVLSLIQLLISSVCHVKILNII